MEVQIFSMNGKRVFFGNSPQGSMEIPLTFGSGNYVVQAGSEGYCTIEKIAVVE
jgi:hypothetical protein